MLNSAYVNAARFSPSIEDSSCVGPRYGSSIDWITLLIPAVIFIAPALIAKRQCSSDIGEGRAMYYHKWLFILMGAALAGIFLGAKSDGGLLIVCGVAAYGLFFSKKDE